MDEATRVEIEKLNKEENQLAIDFAHALNEENTLLEFTDEELGETSYSCLLRLCVVYIIFIMFLDIYFILISVISKKIVFMFCKKVKLGTQKF